LRWLLEAVFHQEVQIVALVQDLALHVGVETEKPPHLAVLLRHELLVERRDLQIDVEGRQVEVGREALRGITVAVPLDIEGRGLVGPFDPVEVEQLRELALAVMCEID
jgi:hypothetical protein